MSTNEIYYFVKTIIWLTLCIDVSVCMQVVRKQLERYVMPIKCPLNKVSVVWASIYYHKCNIYICFCIHLCVCIPKMHWFLSCFWDSILLYSPLSLQLIMNLHYPNRLSLSLSLVHTLACTKKIQVIWTYARVCILVVSVAEANENKRDRAPTYTHTHSLVRSRAYMHSYTRTCGRWEGKTLACAIEEQLVENKNCR